MMTYTSKLVCGQMAWMMEDNRVIFKPVESVAIQATANEYTPEVVTETVSYGFRLLDARGKFREWKSLSQNQVFSTKEELLASL